MSPSSERAPVEAIRHAVALAVDASSLRKVAARVGMSPTGLRQFLDGRSPYRATLRKLNEWYVKYQLETHGFSADAARAALRVLLEAIPEAELDAAGAKLLACLREVHRDSRVAPPGWLAQLSG